MIRFLDHKLKLSDIHGRTSSLFRIGRTTVNISSKGSNVTHIFHFVFISHLETDISILWSVQCLEGSHVHWVEPIVYSSLTMVLYVFSWLQAAIYFECSSVWKVNEQCWLLINLLLLFVMNIVIYQQINISHYNYCGEFDGYLWIKYRITSKYCTGCHWGVPCLEVSKYQVHVHLKFNLHEKLG